MSITSDDRSLLAWAEARLPAMLADVQELVECESPSADLAAVAASADLVARIASERLDIEPDRVVLDGRTHLRWRVGSLAPDAPRVLVLAHHDTVWPIGSLATHPFSIEEGVLRGPGSFDMLTGLVMAVHAVEALGRLQDAAVTLLVTGDEELGSPTSRALIEQEAAGCVAALVLEASGDGGALKIGRKGVSRYRIEITGRASHAGLEPEQGINAIVEMGHQVGVIARLARADVGTSVTPTVAQGGTTSNTVAAHAELLLDVRAFTAAEQRRVDDELRALESLTGATLTVHGGINRPPMETSAAQGLWQRAADVAARHGWALPAGIVVGGASDGNFTAGVGVATLDGLGAVGGGAHADHEHVIVDEIPRRTALLVALLRELLGLDLPS